MGKARGVGVDSPLVSQGSHGPTPTPTTCATIMATTTIISTMIAWQTTTALRKENKPRGNLLYSSMKSLLV